VARVIATADAGEQKKIIKSSTLPKTGADARDRVKAAKGHFAFPASEAAFDLSSYKGARWVDDRGIEHLMDREEVKRLQTEAAKARAAAESARGTWAFAAFEDFPPHYLGKTDDPAKAGYVVTVEWDCRIHVETGIDIDAWKAWKAPARTVDPEAEARHKREEERVKARAEASEAWTAAVRAKLRGADHTHVGVALVVLGMLTSRMDFAKRRLKIDVLGAGEESLPFFQAALGRKAVDADKTYRQVVLTGESPEAEVLRTLTDEPAVLTAMLSAVAAAGLRPPLVRGEAPWVTDAHQMLADLVGVPIPPALRADFDDPLPANAVREEPEDEDDQLDIEDAIDAVGEAA
jgi:hypothetical protein